MNKKMWIGTTFSQSLELFPSWPERLLSGSLPVSAIIVGLLVVAVADSWREQARAQ
jgi:hypothetical protein